MKLSNFKSAAFLVAGALAFACLWTFCKPSATVSGPIGIGELRKIAAGSDPKAREKDYEIEGYFWNETVPMLVVDPKWLNINTAMPDSNFILLSGPGFEKMRRNDSLPGQLIRIKGRIDPQFEKGRPALDLDLFCPDLPVLLGKRFSELIWQRPIPFCTLHPEICTFKPPFWFKKKYAILFSGGINAASANLRYWNDLKFMYLTLRNKYGYRPENIVVIYKNGTGEDSDIEVDFAASPTGWASAISFLKPKMTTLDDLFFFATNHGGGWHRGGGHQGIATAGNFGGVADASGDEIDPQRFDETVFYFGQSNNTILDDQLAAFINQLPYGRRIAVLEPCFSGGLLRDLRGANSIAISACDEFQFSWGGPTVDGASYDAFSYYFTEALNRATPGGTALATNPDSNGDGRVSILEAFLYAKGRDTANEVPLLDDNGDGDGTNSPTAAAGADGVRSNTTKL